MTKRSVITEEPFRAAETSTLPRTDGARRATRKAGPSLAGWAVVVAAVLLAVAAAALLLSGPTFTVQPRPTAQPAPTIGGVDAAARARLIWAVKAQQAERFEAHPSTAVASSTPERPAAERSNRPAEWAAKAAWGRAFTAQDPGISSGGSARSPAQASQRSSEWAAKAAWGRAVTATSEGSGADSAR